MYKNGKNNKEESMKNMNQEAGIRKSDKRNQRVNKMIMVKVHKKIIVYIEKIHKKNKNYCKKQKDVV